MSGAWNDFNDADEQTSYDIIPKGTIAPVRMTIKPGGYDDPAQGWTGGYATRNETTGSVYLNAEFVLLEGPARKAPGVEPDRPLERQGPRVGQHGPFVRARHPELGPRALRQGHLAPVADRAAHRRPRMCSTASSSWPRSMSARTGTAIRA